MVSKAGGGGLMEDEPDLGYINSNNPPQGEVWLRGPNVFKG